MKRVRRNHPAPDRYKFIIDADTPQGPLPLGYRGLRVVVAKPDGSRLAKNTGVLKLTGSMDAAQTDVVNVPKHDKFKHPLMLTTKLHRQSTVTDTAAHAPKASAVTMEWFSPSQFKFITKQRVWRLQIEALTACKHCRLL